MDNQNSQDRQLTSRRQGTQQALPDLIRNIKPLLPEIPAEVSALLPPDERKMLSIRRSEATLGQVISSGNPDELHAGIRLKMLEISKIIGINEPPDAHQLSAVTDFLLENFSDFTPTEICSAFSKWASGSLELPQDVKPYGSLSIPFIGQVLKQYRSNRQRAEIELKKVEYRIGREQELSNYKPLSPEGAHEIAKEIVAIYGKIPAHLAEMELWAVAWSHLNATNQLAELDSKQANELIEQVRSELWKRHDQAMFRGEMQQARDIRDKIQSQDRIGDLHLEVRKCRARMFYLTPAKP